MKKVKWVIIAILILIVLIPNLNGNKNESSPKEELSSAIQSIEPSTSDLPAETSTVSAELTLTQLAEDTQSAVGEFQKSYALQPSGGFSIDKQEDITKMDEVTIQGNVLKNVVIVKTVSGYDYMKAFLEQYAAFEFYDDQGNSNSSITSYVWDDGDYIEAILTSDKSIDNIKFVKFRGLSDHNSSTSILYEIK